MVFFFFFAMIDALVYGASGCIYKVALQALVLRADSPHNSQRGSANLVAELYWKPGMDRVEVHLVTGSVLGWRDFQGIQLRPLKNYEPVGFLQASLPMQIYLHVSCFGLLFYRGMRS